MNIVTHGGACCGISHIYSLGGYNGSAPPDEDKIKTLKEFRDQTRSLDSHPLCGQMKEVCINTLQRDNGWDKVLEDLDFKLVTSFANPNNAPSCVFVYHYVPEQYRI